MPKRIFLVPKIGDGLTIETAWRPKFFADQNIPYSVVDFGAKDLMAVEYDAEAYYNNPTHKLTDKERQAEVEKAHAVVNSFTASDCIEVIDGKTDLSSLLTGKGVTLKQPIDQNHSKDEVFTILKDTAFDEQRKAEALHG